MTPPMSAATNGHTYLLAIVAGRYDHLARFAVSRSASAISRGPLLSALSLAKEAVSGVVGGIARALASEAVIKIPEFGSFETTSTETVRVLTVKDVEIALRSSRLTHDPSLSEMLGGDDYWAARFKKAGDEDAVFVRSVVADTIGKKYSIDKTFAFPVAAAAEAADLAVRAFFSASTTLIVLKKSMWISGLGQFKYAGTPTELAFTPSEAVLQALRLHEQRRTPFKEHHLGNYADAKQPFDRRILTEALPASLDVYLNSQKIPEENQKESATFSRLLRRLMGRSSA